MKQLRHFYICLICIASFLIVAPIAKIDFNDNQISTSENRYLANFPIWRDSITHQFNSQFYPEFESWLNDHIGFRENMVELVSKIDHSIFNTAFHNNVFLGVDNWMFFNAEFNMDIPFDKYPVKEPGFIRMANTQQAIADSLAKRGIDYYLFLPPSKCSIYPEKINPMLKTTCTAVDQFVQQLKEKTHIKFISPKEHFLTLKDSVPLYFKRDSHWQDEGYKIAYEQVLDTLRSYGYDLPPIDFTSVYSAAYGDLASMMKLDYNENYKCISITHPQAVEVQDSALWAFTEQIYVDKTIYTKNGCFHSYTNHKNGKKLLMYGDSFTASTLSRFLREHFSETIFLQTDKLDLRVIDYVQPDVVIFERGERGLYSINWDIKWDI